MFGIRTLLLLGALALIAAATSRLPRITVRGFYAAVMILNLADYLTTTMGIQLLGVVELNPIMAIVLDGDGVLVGFLFTKLILPSTLFVVAAWDLEKWELRKRRRGRFGPAFSCLLLLTVVTSNVAVLSARFLF